MRVLHFSTYDHIGGAARATFRLHEGLSLLGVKSDILVRKKKSADNDVHVAPLLPRRQWRFWNFIENGCLNAHRTSLSNTFFTAGYPGFDLADEEVVRQADILHFHWVGHFLSPPALAALANLGKPIVWTLHDQRPLTGGCHFSAGCEGYTQECRQCPQLDVDPFGFPARNLRDLRELLPANAFTIVAPSRWLADCARRSALFRQSRVEVIPYGIETDQFCPMDQAQARVQLGLDPKRFHVLFGADAGSEKRKGATELIAAFRHLLAHADQPENITLLCFGEMPTAFRELGSQVHSLGYLRSPEKLREAYAAANVFALPSLEDNLPNTMLEALGCGTPVVGFNIGGVPDVVTDGVTGRLAPAGDTKAFGEGLLEIYRDQSRTQELGRNGAQLIASQYSLATQAARYRDLYATLAPVPSVPKASKLPRTGPHVRAALAGLFLHALKSRIWPQRSASHR